MKAEYKQIHDIFHKSEKLAT